MNLRLSQDEFTTLIDMVSLAAEVASLNQKPGTETSAESFADLEDKILARARAEGYHGIIEVDPDTGKNRVTADYQAGSYIQSCIDEMRNEIFWDELSFRLAERELIREIGENNYLSLPEERRMTRISPLQKRYWDRFTRHGIDHLHEISPPGQG
ncbi:hypothetical protein [Roseibacillus ishigakijimensis]|uniref:Uncharacterized protein n=1 Tax=Roseibacillus ishigakijimensis TaxID=454146 RepID=A0A934VLH2_9BACT|nr:hypothetical protein [Roseibacillus ishigakijimensis]MBK1833237.1 hypothetical protein [Roseibacillus ishigakijimensis]